MKTADALNMLIVLEERVARVYFGFFRTFREDPVAAECWWELARDEYGHAGLLKMVRELVASDAECGEIGPRLWSLVETVERCEQQAGTVDSLPKALELAIRLESSELDALGDRFLRSLGSDLPGGAARAFSPSERHRRHLAEAAGRTADPKLRQHLETLLGDLRAR